MSAPIFKSWTVSVLELGKYVSYSFRDEPTDGQLDRILSETGATSATVTPPTVAS